MKRYAKDTSVSVDRSIMELRSLFQGYEAEGFAWEEVGEQIRVGCVLQGFRVRFEVPLPDLKSRQFTETPTGRERTESQADALYDQEVRRRWRVLVLAVKAKLELIQAEVSTVEREFLADLVLPNGETISERLAPQIKRITQSGTMPKLLTAEVS